MLLIASTPLPRSEYVYTACRLACLDLRERLELAHQLDLNPERNFGFLTEVPFLRNVPAQVQMELLLNCWSRHVDVEQHLANLLDESILYAVCETAARMIRTEPEICRRLLSRGPRECRMNLTPSLADALQALHLNFARDGLFLLLTQFQDLPPAEAEALKSKYGLNNGAEQCLLDVLGRWFVDPAVLKKSDGLLTRVETEQLGTLLEASRCCRAQA